MTFEGAFSAIETDIKDFEFEIPNDGLSRVSETRISDLKQKQHKKWNLDFSDKVRQSKIFFLNRDLPFWHVKNCTANSTFVAPDLNASFYPKWVQKKMPEKASALQFLELFWASGWRWVHWNVEYSLGRSKFFQKLPNRPK